MEEEHASRLEYVLGLLTAMDEWGILADCSALDCSRPGVLVVDYLDFQLKIPSTGDFSYIMYLMDQAFENEKRPIDRQRLGHPGFHHRGGQGLLQSGLTGQRGPAPPGDGTAFFRKGPKNTAFFY